MFLIAYKLFTGTQMHHFLCLSLQKAVRQAGIDESPASPDNLPWFDLLAHPAKWKLEQAYLNNASIEQLVGLGKMVSAAPPCTRNELL